MRTPSRTMLNLAWVMLLGLLLLASLPAATPLRKNTYALNCPKLPDFTQETYMSLSSAALNGGLKYATHLKDIVPATKYYSDCNLTENLKFSDGDKDLLRFMEGTIAVMRGFDEWAIKIPGRLETFGMYDVAPYTPLPFVPGSPSAPILTTGFLPRFVQFGNFVLSFFCGGRTAAETWSSIEEGDALIWLWRKVKKPTESLEKTASALALASPPAPPFVGTIGRRGKAILKDIDRYLGPADDLQKRLITKCRFESKWQTKKGHKVTAALLKVWYSNPVQCLPKYIKGFQVLTNFIDLLFVNVVQATLLEEIDRWVKAHEIAQNITRPLRPVGSDCKAGSGRRILSDAADSAAATHLPLNKNLSNTSFPFDSSLPPHSSRRLRADILQDYQAVLKGYQDIGEGIVGSLESVGSALSSMGVQNLFPLEDTVTSIADTISSVADVFDPIGGILDTISDVLGSIRCPDWLGFVCNLSEYLEGFIDDAVKAITGKSPQEWIDEVLNGLGLMKPFEELKRLFNGVADQVDETFAGMTEVGEKVTKAVEDMSAQVTRYLDFSVWDVVGKFYEEPIQISDGVTEKYTRAVGGAPASFECGSDEYPMVKTALRTSWYCQKDLSVYLRFPCDQASSCTKEYASLGNGDCQDQRRNGSPDKAFLDDMKSDLLKRSANLPLDFEDYFTAQYYCVRNDVTFDLLPELMTAVKDYGMSTAGVWKGAGQKRMSMSPFLKLADTNGVIDQPKCNHKREVYIEYYKPPTVDGKAWNPCQTEWIAIGGEEDQNLPEPEATLREQYRRELCWWQYGPVVGRQKTALPDSTSYGNSEYGWGAFDCAGDASGVYSAFTYGHSSRTTVYYPNMGQCLAAKKVQGQYDCTLSSAETCSCGCSWLTAGYCGGLLGCNCPCSHQQCDNQVSPADRITARTPKQVCASNYLTPAVPGAAARRVARAARQAVMDQYQAAGGEDDPVTQFCKDTFKWCTGNEECSPTFCVPDVLQWACVAPGDAQSKQFLFGDTQRQPAYTIICPVGKAGQIRSAAYGTALDHTDVTEKVAKGCSGRNCVLDLKNVEPNKALWKGKTLQVDMACVCGDGFKPGQAEADECVSCAAGTFRKGNMVECLPCPSGTYSQEGSAECTQCRSGTFSLGGSSNCTECPLGQYSWFAASIDCQPCSINYYANQTGTTYCTACQDGYFSGANGTGTITCQPCPEGTYRSGYQSYCLPCPAGSIATAGSPECTKCPAGTFSRVTKGSACQTCDIGSYSETPGSTQCQKCPKGYRTATTGSTTASACSIKDKAVDYEAAAKKLGYKGGGYAKDLCLKLLKQYGVKTDVDLGNGFCNRGPHNAAVCGYDKGDCCKSTCKPKVIKTGNTTFNFDFSCDDSTFQCKDPKAKATGETQPPTSSGGAVSPGYNSGNSGKRCKPPGTPEPAGARCPVNRYQDHRIGDGFCDDDLNIKACGYDGGDCCALTCKNSGQLGSCAPSSFNCRDVYAYKC